MNRVQVKANLPVFQAFAEGKIIQFVGRHSSGLWADCAANALFDFDRYNYRVKPEPKELFIVKRADGSQVGPVLTTRLKAEHELEYYERRHGAEYGPYTLEEYVQVVK